MTEEIGKGDGVGGGCHSHCVGTTIAAKFYFCFFNFRTKFAILPLKPYKCKSHASLSVYLQRVDQIEGQKKKKKKWLDGDFMEKKIKNFVRIFFKYYSIIDYNS